MSRTLTVVHIITGLNNGGSERSLYSLTRGGLKDHFKTVVISLTDEGHYGPMLRKLGVPVYALSMSGGSSILRALWNVQKIVRKYQPDVIQGWMYHGNIVAQLSTFFSSRSIVVCWNIRQCLYDLGAEKKLTRAVIRISRALSHKPSYIIYNSMLSRLHHEEFGFSSQYGLVISNGFDPNDFAPNLEVRAEIRQTLGLKEENFVFGHAGRFHPMKDHISFLRSAIIVAQKNSAAFFLLAGNGINVRNIQLMRYIPIEFRHKFLLLDDRNDMPYLYNAMDVFCLSSSAEAFPNVLAEAMLTNLTCITTDVGDSAYIVGDVGSVVPPGRPDAFASAMLQVMGMQFEARTFLGNAARKRVETKFSLKVIVRRYTELYHGLV